MRKILLAFLIVCFVHEVSAQFVTIPDSNFRKYLLAHFPSAMLGNTMDTTYPGIVNATSVDCDSMFIVDIDGIQYFDNLVYLSCEYNLIKSFPNLPNTITTIICKVNQLDSLPSMLPPNLTDLYCESNQLKKLPIFPISTLRVNCSYNLIDTIVSFPTQIEEYYCASNLIQHLPVFPNSIVRFNCAGNMINTLPSLPPLLQYLYVSSNPLGVLPTLPSSLVTLVCGNNNLTGLPTLPINLDTLVCSNNMLSTLPSLPINMAYLNCELNSITMLPTLPNDLVVLNCNNNLLTTLPSLPPNLDMLNCSVNSIPSLPFLPLSLRFLDYSANPITTMPSLPMNLNILIWNWNPTPILPSLPASLWFLEANHNLLDSLPTLPVNLNHLSCSNDSLLVLPPLPQSLNYLDVSSNFLSVLPPLPNQLYTLHFANNLISTFNTMPSSVRALDCSGNTSIPCLPRMPKSMDYIRFNNTSINCLPSHFLILDSSKCSNNLNTVPLCLPASGCLCVWNIAGNLHSYIASTCQQDSITPGANVLGLKVGLYKNGLLQNDMFLTSRGEYSFDTGDNDTLDVVPMLAGTQFIVACPSSGTQQVILSPLDSMKPSINFAVECNGIDAGVQSMAGRFRPGVISHISLKAGDLAQMFNVICTTINPGTVTTVIEGPVTYLQPSVNALTPSLINGNVLTYNVSNLSALDYKTAFGIDVITDISATMGSKVCVKTEITNVANDINATNDKMEVCFPVVNSFDPNAKYVSPASNSEPGDWLTYTIQFQNTGNDTAYKIVVRDTLSENLDEASFTYMGSSHNAEVVKNGKFLAFEFNDINLLDSLHNEPESHGWLQFKIQLKTMLPYGTKTYNRASIYFDFNDPILTNIATNYIGPDTTYEVGSNPIKVPNAITPNRDGLNDIFHVINNNYLTTKSIKIDQIVILNRYGQQMYIGGGNEFKWEPMQDVPLDVYAYKIVYHTFSGNSYIQRGDIVLIR